MLGTPSLVLCGSESNGVAATVFTGGTILTVDTDFSEGEAIAIRGNTIIAVGSDADVRAAAGANARVVDLGGRMSTLRR